MKENELKALRMPYALIAPLLVLAVVAVSGVAYAASSTGGGHDAHAGHSLSPAADSKQSAADFRADMRQLWEDHIVYTRLFIVSFAADLPDLQATTDRLLANQTHIGDAVKPYYGDEGGAALTELLREHILDAADLLTAAKSGDSAAFDAANVAWYDNADRIAQFLHNANPGNWGLEETQHHMRMHLDLTLSEAAHRLGGDFEQDIADYDAVHLAILEMSDYLSQGIIDQFPHQFRGPLK
jgi:hypothetical protein